MSEFINNKEKRLQDLLAFSQGIMAGEDGRQLMDKYRESIDSMTPHDMLAMEDRQLQLGITPGAIKEDIEKVINTFFKSLAKYPWEKPVPDSFLGHLMRENQALTEKLQQIKEVLKSYRGQEEINFQKMKPALLDKFQQLQEFEPHYVKKENILFPYLEKTWDNYRPLTVMWSLHDDIHKALKQIITMLEQPGTAWQNFSELLGQYFFLVFGMIQKENLIIYPVAVETVADKEWESMYEQSFDYPFPFIEAPVKKVRQLQPQLSGFADKSGAGFVSETGRMSYEQVLLAFNHLPVDVTFVDENDKVCFFNRAKDRFFPRSPAIIGRDVKNCHPPESVHIVEEIVSAFRNGTRDAADFRIKMHGRYILIQYFAVRDDARNYRGVIEVSQDITELVQLTGEKRLLDWES